MVCYVIGEPEFEASNWYREIVDGLLFEKKQKRFTIVFGTSVLELANYDIGHDDFVFVIGNDSKWIADTTFTLSEKFGNRVIVLGNHERQYSGKYSVVTSDIGANVKMLCKYLTSLGKSKIAMYGINPASVSDTYKAAAFKSLMGESAEIYYNDASLAECFDVFADTEHTPDAVICVNIYAAVSLVKKIGDSTDIFVTSLGGGLLSEFTKANITCVESDYRSFAGAGLELARILVKNDSISSLTACVKGRFKPAESTNGIPYRESGVFRECVDTRGDIRFYSDKDVQEMLKIEQMLSQLGDGDYEMLLDILDGETYQHIAEKRFCSEGTVKYKMKHLYDICGVKGRSEFVELIDKYI